MSEGGFLILVGILIVLGIVIFRLDKHIYYFPPKSELGTEGHFDNGGKDGYHDFDFFDGDGDDGGDGD
ncbi:hypothetical protein [Ammoniphilus sp. 3BR4]|uniref:hypothetical protein n=1 Tax=Ammoniphilus sp. 3BR4 TaxID=3158265 RepID=UPI003466FA51